MKKVMILMTIAFLLLASSSFAAEAPVAKEVETALDTFAEGCQAELTSYCKGVTPGEGRIMACMYAFGDKLSPRCENAMYDSIAQLNLTLTRLAIAINECEDDIDSFCSEINPGEGRLFDCLTKSDKVSKQCLTALQDVGWIK